MNKFLEKNWRLCIIGIIGILNAVLIFSNNLFNFIDKKIGIALFNLIIAFIYCFFEIWQRVSENNEVKEVRISHPQAKEITETREEVKQVLFIVQEKRKKVEKKKDETRLISNLVKENIISIQSLENNISDKKFITVFCYQKGFKYQISKKVKDLIRQKRIENIKRKYTEAFEKMGFIQLGPPYPFFIIAEDNIFPEQFKKINNLSNYLIKVGQTVIADEWNEIKKLHSINDTEYYNKIKNIDNPLNFNMLLMKINRRDMRQRYIKNNDFNQKFSEELVSLIKIEKLKINHNEEIELKNIVVSSSLKILIIGIENKNDQKRIMELENIFKKSKSEGGLDIKRFFDYAQKEKEDIKKILLIKFKNSPAKVEEYATMLIENSGEYKKALDKLKIT